MFLKIFSWNIWYHGNMEKVNNFLEKSGADIIGLQEVMQLDKTIQLSKRLKTELNYKYVYAPVFQIQKNGQTIDVGNAIFSKYPIVSNKIHNLSKTDNRVAIETNIQISDKILHVFNTHLLHTHQQVSKTQDLQAENLIKVLKAKTTILMGDFNALPKSNTIRKISSVLKNADPDLRPTWSVYPEGCEDCTPQRVIYKLDNIFTSRDLRAYSYQVEKSEASDHLPISAVIEI